MPKEIADPAEATGEAPAQETPAGIKFIKNLNPHEVITLPGKKTFSFKGKTTLRITDEATISALRAVAKQYSIFEDPPFVPAKK